MTEYPELIAEIERFERLLPGGVEVDADYLDLSYIRGARVANRVADDAVAGRTDYFETLFAHIEDVLGWATLDLREFIIVGVIEDIQNAILNRGSKLNDWHRWLGPRTLEAWDIVDRYWRGKVPPKRFNRFIAGD
jgi:hypothetical protein